jgi:hypothetical protein
MIPINPFDSLQISQKIAATVGAVANSISLYAKIFNFVLPPAPGSLYNSWIRIMSCIVVHQPAVLPA